MITHMNPTMLAHVDEAKAAGVLVAEDGASLAKSEASQRSSRAIRLDVSQRRPPIVCTSA